MSGMRFPRLARLCWLRPLRFAPPSPLRLRRSGSAPLRLRCGRGNSTTHCNCCNPELQRSPKNPQLWTFRGIALSGKGDKKEALSAFRHALANSPDYLPALEGAAQIEVRRAGGRRGLHCCNESCICVRTIRPAMPCWRYWRTAAATVRVRCLHFELQSGSLAESQPGALQWSSAIAWCG